MKGRGGGGFVRGYVCGRIRKMDFARVPGTLLNWITHNIVIDWRYIAQFQYSPRRINIFPST